MTWRDLLSGNPLPWLLEPEDPAVRYWTLRDLLDRPSDDAAVRDAWTSIASGSPVADLLAAQKPDGYWVKRDFYLPKHSGTFWVLIVLADLGLTAEVEGVQRGCEYLFAFQREHGGFCRRRRVQGRGIVWDEQGSPCTHARIVRLLLQFGYADDSRTRAALGWVLDTQRDDGMWHCRQDDRHGCLRATLDVLRAAVLDPATAAELAISRAAEVVCALLMERRMGRFHVPDLWTVLEYPYFGYSVLGALDVLGRLGYGQEEPKVAAALEYVLSRQRLDGTWPLDGTPRRPPFDVGQPGQPNKWLTLDALRVIKLFCGER
jgi:hypothetical protein